MPFIRRSFWLVRPRQHPQLGRFPGVFQHRASGWGGNVSRLHGVGFWLLMQISWCVRRGQMLLVVFLTRKGGREGGNT
jgi:hypothetical protein